MKNVVLMCFAKKGAGPAFCLAFAEGLKKSGQKVFCIVSERVNNRDEWELAAANHICGVMFLDTGDRKTVIGKTIKLLFKRGSYKRSIEKYFDGKVDISITTLAHPWMVLVNSGIKPIHQITIVHDPKPHSGEKRMNSFLAEILYSLSKEMIVLTRSFIPVIIDKYHKDRSDIYYMQHGKYSSYKKYSLKSDLVSYPDSKFNFLFFGRMERYKGVDILLEAYKDLHKKYDNITLTIAGNGSLEEDQINIIDREGICLINRYIDDSEIATLFTGPNLILVLPYLDATQSGVIPVAIDFNIPIIASDSGGLKEQLNDGELGLFAEPGNVQSLYSCMEKCIVDKELLDSQIQKTKEFSAELEWSNVSVQLMKEIEIREKR